MIGLLVNGQQLHNCIDYVDKMQKMLDDTDVYKPLTKDPSLKQERHDFTVVALEEEWFCPGELVLTLFITNHHLALWSSYHLSKYLLCTLSPLGDRSDHHVQNSA